MSIFKNIKFDKLMSGLSKTRDKIVNKITETVTGKAVLDDLTIEELEEVLITSDMGADLSFRVIEETRKRVKSSSDRSNSKLIETVKEVLKETLRASSKEYDPDISSHKPYVILIVGVNGAGKTTTIGKLAHNFRQSGLSVLIGAADTFRAAANDQLEVWAQRAGVDIIQIKGTGDPSAVAYETVDAAIKRNVDVVMIDTAGRLHTKTNLMDELKKIRTVVKKKLDYAPNEVFLVVDGNTGQNAIVQAEEFSKATELTGLIITKLDGTAKGGVIFQICSKLKIPVTYIGMGEGIEDLQNFDLNLYIDAMLTPANQGN